MQAPLSHAHASSAAHSSQSICMNAPMLRQRGSALANTTSCAGRMNGLVAGPSNRLVSAGAATANPITTHLRSGHGHSSSLFNAPRPSVVSSSIHDRKNGNRRSVVAEAASSDAVPGPLNAVAQRIRGLLYSPYDKEIWAVAIPALASMMLDPIMGAINSALIGQMGTAYLSAVSMGSLSVSLCTFVFSFLLFITVPEIAAAVAKKQEEKVSQIAAKGIWIASFFGILTTLSVFFGADAIIAAMRPADADVGIYALEFIKIRSFGITAALIGFVASGTYRGFKDTKTPLKCALVSTMVCLFLNILFIHGLGWGVFGSGLATTLAQCVSCGLLVYNLIATKRYECMIVFASLLCVRAGAMYQASFEVLRQIWILTAQAFECLNVATQALCATYLGLGDVKNARAIMMRLATLGIMIATVASTFVFIIKFQLVSFFTCSTRSPCSASASLALPLLPIHSPPSACPPLSPMQIVFNTLPLLCFCFPFDAVASIMDGSLMASKQTDYLSVVQIGGALVQYGLLIYLSNNNLVSTFGIWTTLKLLTAFRMCGGLYRNFFSKKSAYLLPAASS
eukprot:gene16261-22439_t